MRLHQALKSSTIELRELNEIDATETYLAWLHDTEVNQFLEVRFALPEDTRDLKTFVRNCIQSPRDLLLGIFLQDSGLHIGNIKLGPIDGHHLTAEIGLMIGDRKFWGKGFAREAICLLAEYSFETLKLAKLTAGCYIENAGSLATFRKAGFEIEGRRVSQWMYQGRRQDGILLGKLNPRLLGSLS